MTARRLPWVKFYPQDWLGDPALARVSFAARGIWHESLCVMWHDGVSSLSATPEGWAQLLRGHERYIMDGIRELETAGVCRVDRSGEHVTLVSRRLARELSAAGKARSRVQRHRCNADETVEKRSNNAPGNAHVTGRGLEAQRPEVNGGCSMGEGLPLGSHGERLELNPRAREAGLGQGPEVGPVGPEAVPVPGIGPSPYLRPVLLLSARAAGVPEGVVAAAVAEGRAEPEALAVLLDMDAAGGRRAKAGHEPIREPAAWFRACLSRGEYTSAAYEEAKRRLRWPTEPSGTGAGSPAGRGQGPEVGPGGPKRSLSPEPAGDANRPSGAGTCPRKEEPAGPYGPNLPAMVGTAPAPLPPPPKGLFDG